MAYDVYIYMYIYIYQTPRTLDLHRLYIYISHIIHTYIDLHNIYIHIHIRYTISSFLFENKYVYYIFNVLYV